MIAPSTHKRFRQFRLATLLLGMGLLFLPYACSPSIPVSQEIQEASSSSETIHASQKGDQRPAISAEGLLWKIPLDNGFILFQAETLSSNAAMDAFQLYDLKLSPSFADGLHSSPSWLLKANRGKWNQKTNELLLDKGVQFEWGTSSRMESELMMVDIDHKTWSAEGNLRVRWDGLSCAASKAAGSFENSSRLRLKTFPSHFTRF